MRAGPGFCKLLIAAALAVMASAPPQALGAQPAPSNAVAAPACDLGGHNPPTAELALLFRGDVGQLDCPTAQKVQRAFDRGRRSDPLHMEMRKVGGDYSVMIETWDIARAKKGGPQTPYEVTHDGLRLIGGGEAYLVDGGTLLIKGYMLPPLVLVGPLPRVKSNCDLGAHNRPQPNDFPGGVFSELDCPAQQRLQRAFDRQIPGNKDDLYLSFDGINWIVETSSPRNREVREADGAIGPAVHTGGGVIYELDRETLAIRSHAPASDSACDLRAHNRPPRVTPGVAITSNCEALRRVQQAFDFQRPGNTDDLHFSNGANGDWLIETSDPRDRMALRLDGPSGLERRNLIYELDRRTLQITSQIVATQPACSLGVHNRPMPSDSGDFAKDAAAYGGLDCPTLQRLQQAFDRQRPGNRDDLRMWDSPEGWVIATSAPSYRARFFPGIVYHLDHQTLALVPPPKPDCDLGPHNPPTAEIAAQDAVSTVGKLDCPTEQLIQRAFDRLFPDPDPLVGDKLYFWKDGEDYGVETHTWASNSFRLPDGSMSGLYLSTGGGMIYVLDGKTLQIKSQSIGQ